jgi:hypothetical protein
MSPDIIRSCEAMFCIVAAHEVAYSSIIISILFDIFGFHCRQIMVSNASFHTPALHTRFLPDGGRCLIVPNRIKVHDRLACNISVYNPVPMVIVGSPYRICLVRHS